MTAHATNTLRALLSAARARPLFLAAFFCVVLVPLILFGKLAEEIHEGENLPFDEPLLHYLHTHSTPERDRWIVRATNFGGPMPMLILEGIVVLVLLVRRRRREAAFLLIAGGGAALLNVSAKLYFSRQRPNLWETIVTETSYSFPSGHSITSMSFAAALTLLAWRSRWRWAVAICTFALAIGIGLTRLYLGVHFPSDVMAAWCAALAWVGGVYTLQRMHPSDPWLLHRVRRPRDLVRNDDSHAA